MVVLISLGGKWPFLIYLKMVLFSSLPTTLFVNLSFNFPDLATASLCLKFLNLVKWYCM